MTLIDAASRLAADVIDADADAAAAARQRWDTLAKPPGSLGVLEDVGVTLAAIAGTSPPPVPAQPSLLVCAADHGVHARGVTPWPQAITTAMVEVMADGLATCSAFARTVGAAVTVLDVGCAIPPSAPPGTRMALRSMRVRAGTADLSAGPAMTVDEAARAVVAGGRAADELIDSGTDLLCLGDMGLANTTASAALIASLTGADAADVTGPGAGADTATVDLKRRIVGDAAHRARALPGPLQVLAEVGGLEHAALVGAMLTAAARGIPVVLDGVISDAAAVVATAMAPALPQRLLAAHRSTEPGAGVALDHLGLRALLDLDLRLGEGTGALLAVPLIRAAAEALSSTAAIADLTLPT